ncbi:MAG: DNA polymerase III subunit delta [Candidatus Nealsonbacteria bacterium]
MIILLYGPDTFRSRKKLNEIIEHYKKANKKGLDLKYIDLESLGFRDFKNEIQQISIFDEKKLLILTNAFSNQEFKESLVERYADFTDDKNIIVFFEEKKVPTNDRLLKFLSKKAKCQEFYFLNKESLKKWTKNQFLELKTTISQDGLDKLVDFVGSDLWRMDNEIKKLVSFKKGKKVELKDLDQLVRPKIETDIFSTIDAIAQKNRKKAIFLLHKHLDKGDSPLYLLSMINYQFRNLLLIKDLIEKQKPYYQISKILKLHPFVVRKSYNLADKFSYQELKKIYQNIFQVDLSIKTGKIKPETALDLFLSEI